MLRVKHINLIFCSVFFFSDLLVVGNILSQVSMLQGPILIYTNTEHNGKKNKNNSFTYTRRFNIFMHNIHAGGITKKEYTNMPQ